MACIHDTKRPTVIPVGYAGEYYARTKPIYIGDLQEAWPGTIPVMTVQRPDETDFYPAADTTLDGEYLVWTFLPYDTGVMGIGKAQIEMVDPDGHLLGKSEVMLTSVAESLMGPAEAPEWYDSYIQRIIDEAVRAEAAAKEAEEHRLAADSDAERAEAAADKAESYIVGAKEMIDEEAQRQVGVVAEAGERALVEVEAQVEQAVMAAYYADQASNDANRSAEAAENSAVHANAAYEKASGASATANNFATQAQRMADSAYSSAAQAQAYSAGAGMSSQNAEAYANSARASSQSASASASTASAAATTAVDAKNTAITQINTAAQNGLTAITEKTEEQLARIPEVTELSAKIDKAIPVVLTYNGTYIYNGSTRVGYVEIKRIIDGGNHVVLHDNQDNVYQLIYDKATAPGTVIEFAVVNGKNVKGIQIEKTGNVIRPYTVTLADEDLANYGYWAYEYAEQLDDVKAEKTEVSAVEQRVTALEERPVVDPTLDRRVTNLEEAAEGNLYRAETDDDAVYAKDVQGDAMPWASVDKVGAKTLVWNQLVSIETGKTIVESGITYTKNDDGTVTADGTATKQSNFVLTQNILAKHDVKGHKVLVLLKTSAPTSLTTYFIRSDANDASLVHYSYQNEVAVLNVSGVPTLWQFNIRVIAGVKVDNVTFNARAFDLTTMFGAGNEPTVEEFRAMFPADYYPYSEPTLMDFAPEKVVSNGRNLLDWKSWFTRNNVEFVQADDGSVTMESQIKLYTNTYRLSDTDETYTISGNWKIVSGANVRFDLLKSNGEVVTTFTGTSTTNKFSAIRMNWSTMGEVRFSDLQIVASDHVLPYTPFREPQTLDLSAIVTKYFPDGMHSAGAVHDEIDLERGVAIQRTAVYTFDGTETGAPFDSYPSSHIWKVSDWPCKSYGHAIITSGETITYTYADTQKVGCFSLSTRVPNTIGIAITIDGITDWHQAADYLNGHTIVYELATPIETPIIESINPYIEVEGGGTVTVTNQHGEEYRVGLPSAVVYKVKAALADDVEGLKSGKADLSLLGGLRFVAVTQEEYNLISVPDASTVYLIVG